MYMCYHKSIAESQVMCSTIRPTYRLSYDNATELLQMNVEEEADLYLLDEVAKARREWRMAQVRYLLKSLSSVLSRYGVYLF